MGFGEWRIFAGIANGIAQLGSDTRLLPGQQSNIACFAYNAGNISLPNGTLTALTMDTELYDTAGIHSTSSNTSRFTIPASQAGYYLFTGTVSIDTGSLASGFGLFFRLNGATLIGSNLLGGSTALGNVNLSITREYQLAVGDYIELCGYQGTGSSRNANGWTSAPNQGISLSIRRLA